MAGVCRPDEQEKRKDLEEELRTRSRRSAEMRLGDMHEEGKRCRKNSDSLGGLCGGADEWQPERPWLSRRFVGHRSGRCYLFLATSTEEQEFMPRSNPELCMHMSSLADHRSFHFSN